MTSYDDDLKDFVRTINNKLQNGPSDLSNKSEFMELTSGITPKEGLVFHSIMGNITKAMIRTPLQTVLFRIKVLIWMAPFQKKSLKVDIQFNSSPNQS